MMTMRCKLAMGALALLCASDVNAQQAPDWDVRQPAITRAALETLRARLDSAAQSSAYGDELRAQARMQAAFAGVRLAEGDFQPGDRVIVTVEGQFTDTLDVRSNRSLALPNIGEVPLAGVLRSELDDRLKEHVARVIVEPVVRARPLISVAVLGEVTRPGYYALGVDTRITEALMHAGGPTATANLDKLTIQRAGEVLYAGESLQQAIVEGKTLNQLGVRPGDRIMLPAQQRRSIGEILRLAIVALPSLAFLFTRM